MVERKLNELGYAYMMQPLPSVSSAAVHSGNALLNTGHTISFVLYRDNGKLLGMNSFFPLILEGIEATARKHGYSLNIVNMDRCTLTHDIQYIKENGSAGFVIFATELQKEQLQEFFSLQIPFVIFDNYFLDQEVMNVKVNNEQGTFLAVKHLHEYGHKRIGYLCSDVKINSFLERQKCTLSALHYFECEEPEKFFYTIGYASENAENGMDKLLDSVSLHDLPTAFLADNDLVAIGAMQSIKKHGFCIPDDFSIIGYDDRPICSLTDPKLTTIQLPRHKFGAAAVDLLIQQIETSDSSPISVEINGKLITRNTVSFPRKEKLK